MKSTGLKGRAKKNYSNVPANRATKFLAVLIAGTLVLAAFISSLFVISVYNKKTDQTNTAVVSPVLDRPVEVEEKVPAEKQFPEDTPPGEIPTELIEDDFPERPCRGRLVFVIDDAGNNLRDLDPFLHFPGPLTIAVLPGLPNSAEAARRVREAGKEVFLHQPMESIAGHNPGPGAVFTGMEEDEIRSIINRNLDEIWPVAGMNNHEGSRVSMDEKIMEIVLSICRDRGIVFLDSRTTANTTAPAAAARLGLHIGERDVFLDNEQDRESIMRYIDTGLKTAERKGSAVMIGHASTPELASLLDEFYYSWISQDYSLLTVTALIKGGL